MLIKFFVVALILNVFLAQHLSQDQSIAICTDTTNGFTTFKAIFNKTYSDSQQEQDAFSAFQECCRTILASNNHSSYTVALHSKCDVILNSITCIDKLIQRDPCFSHPTTTIELLPSSPLILPVT